MRAYRILGRVAGVWGDGWGGYPSKWYKEHDPASDCYVRFEGWGGMRVSGDMKRLTVYCMDRSYQLRRVMMYNPPYFDGWCVYYAIKSLLQRGGIDVVDLGLMPNQPSDSWTCDGFTCDHPRMRRGTGENPLMRFPQGTSVWQAMQEIRRLYSFALGFIRNKFYFYPWEPWQAREEFVASRTFDAVPIFTGGVPDLNEFIDDVFVSRDLSDTRTGMTLVGLNKDDWQPISAHRFDPAATGVDNEGVPLGNRTYLPINFKGFHDEYVESSAMFVDKEFLNYATDRIWNIMRFPRHRERLRVWWQPIDPLDYVSIGPHRMRTSEEYEKFYVASVIEDINPESATCTIECELLPYQTQDAQNHQGDTMEIIVPPEISDSGGVYNSTEVSLSEDEDAKIPYAIADQSAADQSVAI
jgi:hypothetical protein